MIVIETDQWISRLKVSSQCAMGTRY